MVKRPNSLNRLSDEHAAGPDPQLMRRFPLFTDMIAAAGARIPKRIAGYLLGGADSEAGLAETTAAFARIRLVPRYGIDVSARSTKIELFGQTYAAPIGVAPVGYASAIWPGSEPALAKAAQRANVPYVNSTFAIEPLESIKRFAPDVAWFQIYYFQSMTTTLALVKRAELAGYRVLVLTIDIPDYSKRTRDHRNGRCRGFASPPAAIPSRRIGRARRNSTRTRAADALPGPRHLRIQSGTRRSIDPAPCPRFGRRQTETLSPSLATRSTSTRGRAIGSSPDWPRVPGQSG